MLPPEEFGHYLAVGANKRTRGQALFFEIDPNFQSDYFDLASIERRCVPHVDGQPKRSVYLSTYRVLENLPIEVFSNLYLTTYDGKVLELQPGDYPEEEPFTLHLYQELSPVPPRVASKLNPRQFMNYVTDQRNPVSFPKVVFAELILNGLAKILSLACRTISLIKISIIYATASSVYIQATKNPTKPSNVFIMEICSIVPLKMDFFLVIRIISYIILSLRSINYKNFIIRGGVRPLISNLTRKNRLIY